MRTTTNNRLVQAYLFFNGRCAEALEYYKEALGAEIEMTMRFKDSPEPVECPGAVADNIMHASLRIGETIVMASDGCGDGDKGFQGFALSLSVPTEAEADRRFAALARGGQVQMPLDKTFFARRFGMVTDRFGVPWMIIVPADQPVAEKETGALVH